MKFLRKPFIIILWRMLVLLFPVNALAQVETGDEQEFFLQTPFQDLQILVNQPARMNKKGRTQIILYALPNGNSIEWTKGKIMQDGDDWHYNIQHIAAQTRYVRNLDRKNNYIVVYLANQLKSWPSWRRNTANAGNIIHSIVDSLMIRFKDYQPELVLNGHSGGGSFIFGYLNAVEKIPSSVTRIAFLDSDYGYEDSAHRNKLVHWLKAGKKNTLVVLAYNDSNVIFNGKPLVSPTGGTWYRSRLMQRNLSATFTFSTETDSAFIRYTALKGQVNIILKTNPGNLIYHTVQVEKNGFIYSLFANTKYDRRKYFTYFGERVYEVYIR